MEYLKTQGIIKLINKLDSLYQSIGITQDISDLVSTLHTKLVETQNTFANFIEGVYYIFGKPLVIWLIGVIAVIIIIRIALAIVNLIYP